MDREEIFKMLCVMLLVCLCLNYIEAGKTRLKDRHKACLNTVNHLTYQLVECRGMFICDYDLGYGAHCIPQSQVCDGYSQCLGGEDEANCRPKPTKCQINEMMCTDENRCARLCNGVRDCMTGIDEMHCDKICKQGQVQCHDGKCAVVGDGKPQCDDKSDENCPICPTCKICGQCEVCDVCKICEQCEVCEVCGAGELSCIHKTTKERECVSTCDTEIDCELQEDKTPLPTCPTTCPSEDWVRFKNSCYKIVSDDRKTMPEAKAACTSLGAHLVNIETVMEMTFLSCTLIERDGPGASFGEYWTGLVKQGSGVWVWEGTGITINGDYWGFNQPDGTDADCAVLYGNHNYLLDDFDCNGQFFHICEIEDS